MSKGEVLAAVVCSDAFWQVQQMWAQHLEEGAGVGRPRACGAADVLALFVASEIHSSMRSADRELGDEGQWNLLRERVESAWPNDPNRRLGPRPPTRYQFMRAESNLSRRDPEFGESFRRLCREHAVEVADFLGLGSVEDSLTHPSPLNFIYGDATWEQSLFNSAEPRKYVNPETGEITYSRCDPDARPFHRSGQSAGNYLVSTMIRGKAPLERVILDMQYKPDGVGDGQVFTEMALSLFDCFKNIRGVTYDMALSARDQDRIGLTGRHVIEKVPRTKNGAVKSIPIGEMRFKNERRLFTETTIAIDGAPSVIYSDAKGEKYKVGLIRVQTKARENVLYNVLEIPHHPLVPESKRGARTMIRIFSSEDDIASSRPRPSFLRSIPEEDPDFRALFGIREDAESMHNNLKSQRRNRRAKAKGLPRRELFAHGYQLVNNIMAVVARKCRTDCDVARFMGEWAPPERARMPLAA